MLIRVRPVRTILVKLHKNKPNLNKYDYEIMLDTLVKLSLFGCLGEEKDVIAMLLLCYCYVVKQWLK